MYLLRTIGKYLTRGSFSEACFSAQPSAGLDGKYLQQSLGISSILPSNVERPKPAATTPPSGGLIRRPLSSAAAARVESVYFPKT